MSWSDTAREVGERLGVHPRVPADERPLVAARAARWFEQVVPALETVYPGADDLLQRIVDLLAEAIAARPARLRRLDRLRAEDPGWLLSERLAGYVTYVDHFAGDLEGVGERLDHLAELGITYLHLMPLLAARPQPNDGGYAVVDYRAVEPALGTMADLRRLAEALHDRGMSLCVDVVVNHTAAEHEWARRAKAGEERYLRYYRSYADRTVPDQWERSLPQVFPDTAPGNFTYDDALGRWVWTTFHSWQWDLDWSNPDVFCEMASVLLDLSAVGVDVLRLDAVPFLWKQMGTRCQNLPEVHLLLQALRGLLGTAAPATAVKGEAIVAPHDLVSYQGVGQRSTTECDLLYHNQLMVQGWSSIAAQDGRLATISLADMAPTPPHATWVTYVRCHDDIGWAIDDGAAAARGWDGPSHRRFLSSYYAGELEYSAAEGAHFQEDFVSGDRRTSGTTAALVGLTRARRAGDEDAVEQAIAKLLLLHALAASYGGIPLIWMGDEVALDNDTSYLHNPHRAGDNRWMHRPPMDWTAVKRAADPDTVEGRVLAGLRHVLVTRAALPTLRGGGAVTPMFHDNDHVLAFARHHPRTGRFVGLANFHPEPQSVDPVATGVANLCDAHDALNPRDDPLRGARVMVPARSMRWLTERFGPAEG